MRNFTVASAIALSCAGCQILIGLDDPPTSRATAIDATGILAGVDVHLTSIGIDETITVGADGIAKFSSRIIDGDAYVVSLVGSPACVLDDNQAGVVTADVTVALTCAGVTRLRELSLSTTIGTQPALVAGQLTYAVAVSELQQTTQVTATPSDATAVATVQPGAIVPLGAGTTAITIVVDHPASPILRSTYTLNVTRSTPLADALYAKANPQQNDSFGYAVALDGDWAAIAAVNESSAVNPDDPTDQGAVSSGAVYVYHRTSAGAAWQRVASLKAPNAQANDLFGASVALSGDRLVVGAPFEDSATQNTADNSASNAGAAYVFRREGAQWVLEQYLKAAVPQAEAMFGWQVAIENDRIVVGAPYTNDVATGSGEAFVFHRTGTTWALEDTLHDDTATGQGGAGDQLGFSVAIANGVIALAANNGEIAGSPAPNTGTVRMYTRAGATWSCATEIAAPDLVFNSSFGTGLALTADRLVVGAPAVTIAQPGAVYVYARAGAAWTLQQKLTADAPTTGDLFGFGVATFGDTIAIGAFREDGPGAGIDPVIRTDASTDSGVAYVFRDAGGGVWTQRHYLKAGSPDDDDWFGRNLALSGDTLLVSQQGDDSGSLTSPTDDTVASAGACTFYR